MNFGSKQHQQIRQHQKCSIFRGYRLAKHEWSKMTDDELKEEYQRLFSHPSFMELRSEFLKFLQKNNKYEVI